MSILTVYNLCNADFCEMLENAAHEMNPRNYVTVQMMEDEYEKMQSDDYLFTEYLKEGIAIE